MVRRAREKCPFDPTRPPSHSAKAMIKDSVKDKAKHCEKYRGKQGGGEGFGQKVHSETSAKHIL